MSSHSKMRVSLAVIALASLSMTSVALAKWHPKPHSKARTVAKHSAVAVHYGSSGTFSVDPRESVTLALGKGRQIDLGSPIVDVFASNSDIADVHVNSSRQIYIFGKKQGNASVYATDKAGHVVYSANIRVDQNIDSIDTMLHAALPDAQITSMHVNGMIILNGLVINPEDAVEAETLVNSYVGNDPGAKVKQTQVINRIKTAAPQQVSLRVRISEVSHSVAKNIGSSLASSQTGANGVNYGISSGRGTGAVGIAPLNIANYPTRDFSTQFGYPAGTLQALPYDPANPSVPINPTNPGTQYSFTQLANAATLGVGGHLLGMDIGAALDLAETDGDAVTLAEPTLTALSGETASFLAGGQIPITIAQPGATGSVITVEYKDYGVSLSFTPTVLADGRISMRVRPEVSELTNDGSINIGGTVIQALKVRRSETTVELGSGQSMVIGGLLENQTNSTTTKAPGLGDVPILGALFRSNAYQRGETE
ncbi:MAG: pilus assembly protein N-terminal domain-containing protein, partial [Alphaproteobacteria bacterium]|nr:pilus assembly protein N-terminal domain-containing protein [Alphaproteobacteria bacterium]